MPAVDSSVIASYEYDPKTKMLVIAFRKGGSHEYGQVPQSVVDQFANAGSKGEYFNKYIRNTY